MLTLCEIDIMTSGHEVQGTLVFPFLGLLIVAIAFVMKYCIVWQLLTGSGWTSKLTGITFFHLDAILYLSFNRWDDKNLSQEKKELENWLHFKTSSRFLHQNSWTGMATITVTGWVHDTVTVLPSLTLSHDVLNNCVD